MAMKTYIFNEVQARGLSPLLIKGLLYPAQVNLAITKLD
jgi:hypothetical protein